jgi:hypothetical protein
LILNLEIIFGTLSSEISIQNEHCYWLILNNNEV